MTTPATIATIRTAHRRKFIAHKMFGSRPTMAATGKYSNIIYEVVSF